MIQLFNGAEDEEPVKEYPLEAKGESRAELKTLAEEFYLWDDEAETATFWSAELQAFIQA